MLYHNFHVLISPAALIHIHKDTHSTSKLEFTLTMALLIETCIRIRFDKNCSLCLARKRKQHHQNSSILSFFLLLSPFTETSQQKRTILSYRISLRILNELWNIIQQYIFFAKLSPSVFLMLLCSIPSSTRIFVCLDVFIEFLSLLLKLNKCLACRIFIAKRFESKIKILYFFHSPFFIVLRKFSAFELQAIILRLPLLYEQWMEQGEERVKSGFWSSKGRTQVWIFILIAKTFFF